MKNPRGATVCAEIQACSTDSPSLSKIYAHYPSRLHTIFKRKMARRWTSSTHDTIHTGVIGRCFHVHLMHQIHGVMLQLQIQNVRITGLSLSTYISPLGIFHWYISLTPFFLLTFIIYNSICVCPCVCVCVNVMCLNIPAPITTKLNTRA